jgi:AcrR family transcriptional regulator
MDEKLNRQDWLSAGLEALAAEGPDGLRIMSIAEQLGVTKGSFYWHFRNLDEFQLSLLEEWEQRHTQQIIQYVEKKGGDSSTKLHNLMNATVGADARLALAIRSWANTHAVAREAQDRVDHDRVVYLTRLLTPLGWSVGEAQTLARWMYCALIGHFNLQGKPLISKQIDLILDIVKPKTNNVRKVRKQ